MTIYIVYLLLILFVPNVCSALLKDKQRAQVVALKILLLLMYLMLALKAETVGSDISGYGEWYDYTKSIPFWDFSYSYMEKGYLLLMKLGNMVGLSFQGFEAVLYAISILSIYYFFKHNSSNVMLSVLILFCLDFYVFASSGLRQTVAVSLCAASFTYLTRSINTVRIIHFKKIKTFIFSILVVFAAASIHRSALLFVPLLLIVYFQFKTLTYAVYLLVVSFLVLYPDFILNYNSEQELSRYEYDEKLSLGLMFVFDVLMFIFYLMSLKVNKVFFDKVYAWQYGNVLLYGFITMLAFSGSMLLRSSLYELVFLAIIMPDAIQSWKPSTRTFLIVAYVAVMFLCLYFLILVPNTLKIVPYKFFFE